MFPSPGDLPNPGIGPWSPALQADSLPAKSPGSVTNSPRFNGLEQQSFILSHQSASWLGSSADLIVVMLPHMFKVHRHVSWGRLILNGFSWDSPFLPRMASLPQSD